MGVGGAGAQWGKQGEGGTLHIQQQGSARGGFCPHRAPARAGGSAWKRQGCELCAFHCSLPNNLPG